VLTLRAAVSEDLATLVLRVAFRGQIREPDFTAGYARFQDIAGRRVAESDFRAAVDDALAAGLIYDPVRLSDGDLQCHWRLEVTPKGAASARGANL